MGTFIHSSATLVYPSSMARHDFYSSLASNHSRRKISLLSKISARPSLAAGISCLCSFWHPDLAAFPSQNSQACKSPLRSCALSGFQCGCPMETPRLKISFEISHKSISSFGGLILSRHLNVESSQKSITRLLCQAGKPHVRQATAVFHGFRRKRVSAIIFASQKRFQEKGHSKPKTFLVKSAYISPPPADLSISPDMDKRNNGQSIGSSAEEIRKPKPIITIELLRDLLWKERGHLGVATVALFGATSCTLTMPIFSGRFFETLIGARSEPLWRLLAKLSAIYALEPVCTIVFITNMIKVWERVMASLRSSLFRRLILQKIEFFDKHKVGELTALLSTDLSSLKDIVHENVSRDRGFRAFSETIGTLVILFFVSPKLAPILGMLVLFVSAFAAIYKRQSVPAFIAYGQAQACISDCANETFAAIRTVRSFGGEKRQISAFDTLVFAFQRSGDSLGWLKSLNESCTRVVIYVSLMALYILGGMKVKTGELAVGNMVSFIGYTFVLTFAVQGLVNTFADIRATLAAVDRINFIVQESDVDKSLAHGIEKEAEDGIDGPRDRSGIVSERSSGAVSTVISGKYRFIPTLSNNVCDLAWSGDVALEDVYFAYPLRPDVEVLKGINLVLSQGTVTAVVGSSGAGKSTIVQLLARFYEPSKGRISLAGEDVRQFSKIEWARAVSIVNQEPVLFALSVAENIAYGLPNEDVSADKVIAAAKAANAHDFVVALPQGYETLVGERGSLLSGGQRQRLAIARALLKNSPILVLDEATSALDSVSEKLVQDALDRLMKGRTTLVIAHRLSTVQRANKIAVCANGKVIEVGSHSELLAKDGAYSALVNSQRLTFE